jgi:NADPH:quinone reductase
VLKEIPKPDIQHGTLAEYIVADARLMALKPKTLSMREAAALPLVSITAVQALEKAVPSFTDHVLVHGGTGGVGHIGVQLAKVLGCQVATTVGTNGDFDLVRGLGADEVINFREEKVEAYVERLTSGFGFDVVFDTVGGKNLTASMEAARANGRLVTTNARVTIDLIMAHSKALSLHVVFMMLPLITGIGREGHGKSLRYIASLADSGHLHPLLDDERFTLETAADAHRRLQSGLAGGKVVVDLV